MRRPLLVLGAVVLLCVPSAAAGRGQSVATDGYDSTALRGQLAFDVYLPPGYGDSNKRFPTVYFLHGLPASASGYHGIGFLVDALRRLPRPPILVAPQGARAGESDPEYLDRGPGRNWETALARELPAYVDAHYRTIANRRGRALVGLSAGGYGAALLGLHHLGQFGVVESWSGYFRATDPAGLHRLDLGSRSSNAHADVHTVVPDLRDAFRRRPTFFAFYVGRSDARFRGENVQFHAELRAARVPHLFRLYGGSHSTRLWREHAREWLRIASAHLAAA